MPWQNIAFLSMAGLLIASATTLKNPPTFEKRACGEDGIFYNKFCYTKYEHLNVMEWKLAVKFCKMRGGYLMNEKSFENISLNKKFKDLFKTPFWSNDRCKVWKIHEEEPRTLKTRDCESQFPVICKWDPWTTTTKCPDGYRMAGLNKCHRVFGELENSIVDPSDKEARAEKKCKEDGAWLANIKSEMDKSFILSSIQKYSPKVNIMVKVKSTMKVILRDFRPGLDISADEEMIKRNPLGFVCEKNFKLGALKLPITASKLCDGGFEDFDGNSNLCFKIFDEHKTWNEAHSFCRKEKANLVSIHSRYDNAIVHLLRLKLKSDMWIGINNQGIPSNWSDGTKIIFKKGKPSQCGTMNDHGKWIDTQCNIKKRFICFKRDTKQSLPKPCDKGTQLNDICYSKECSDESEKVFLKSKLQAGFLLEWAEINQTGKCLEIQKTTESLFENVRLAYNETGFIDYLAVQVRSSCTTVQICEQKSAKSPKSTSPPSLDKSVNSAILIISILSSLLGIILITLVVGITIYFLVLRPRVDVPRPLETELKPNPKPKPIAQLATIGNSRGQAILPPPLPTLPNSTPVEEEGMMEEIYEDMDDMK